MKKQANIVVQQGKSPSKYDQLSQNIEQLRIQLQKRENIKKQQKIKRQEQLHHLFESLQQKSNSIGPKIEELIKKPVIIIQIIKILKQIPSNFPNHYYIQIVYEDINVVGNQKSVDVCQNIVDEKFTIPLLSSQTAKLQIWVAGEQPSLYDRCTINLQLDIESILMNEIYINELKFEQNKQLFLEYKIQIEGIGFNSWIKNIKNIRDAQQQRKNIKIQLDIQTNNYKIKIAQKKKQFQSKFQIIDGSEKTKQYDLKGIQEIINILNLND